MKKTLVTILAAIVLAGPACQAYAESDAYQVTFETVDCNGGSGFATVAVDRIYKIQAAGCAGPDGGQLKQMLVRDGSGSYMVYTLSGRESENVMKEVKAYMDARRGILERSEAIIIKP